MTPVSSFRDCRWSRFGGALIERPFLFFLFWSFWLSSGYLVFGRMSYVSIHDNADSVLPMLLAWSHAPLASWNPLALCGIDWKASGAPALQSLALVFAAFPGWLAYGLVMWLQRLVAGYFMFRLLRDNLKLTTLPCLVAGLAYSLFAQPSNNGEWAGFTLYDAFGLPGLPFLLWMLHRLAKPRGWGTWLGAFGLGIASGFGVSYAFVPFPFLAIFLWWLFISPERSVKAWLILITLISGCVVANLPLLWAGAVNAPLSQRANWAAVSPLSRGWLGSVWFDYGIIRDNAVAMGLAAIGLIISRGRDRRLLWLCLFLLLSLLGILGYQPVRTALYSHLGFLAGFQFDRVYLVIPFLAIVAAAIGLDLIFKEHQRRVTRGPHRRDGVSAKTLAYSVVIVLVLAQSCWVNIKILGEIADGTNYATLYQNPEMQQLVEKSRHEPPFRVATIAAPSEPPLHPAYAWAYELETADGYVVLYPERYQEFWEQVIGPLIKADRNLYNYFHYWGSRVYLFSPPNQSIYGTELPFKDCYSLKLLSLANVRYIISARPLPDGHLSLLPSNVREQQLRWARRGKISRLLDILRGRCPGMPLFIYENSEVLPRYFLAGNDKAFQSRTALLNALAGASWSELRSTVFLMHDEMAELPLAKPEKGAGNIKILRLAAGQVELEVNTDSPGILVAANSYSPYWKASVDGQSVPLFPVDEAFQGVYIKRGRHQVLLTYEPPYAL